MAFSRNAYRGPKGAQRRPRPAWLDEGEPTDLIDKHQAAEWFGVTPATVEKWFARGIVDSILVGHRAGRRAMRCDIAAHYEHLWKTTLVNPESLAS